MNNYYGYILCFVILYILYYFVNIKYEIKKELVLKRNLDYHYKNVLVPA